MIERLTKDLKEPSSCYQSTFDQRKYEEKIKEDRRLLLGTLTTAMTAQAPLSLDEEARLYTSNAERERYGLLATLFGIIVSLDYLERAYVRDSVPAAE